MDGKISIPVQMLCTFLEFMEVATSRGAVQKVEELKKYGDNYEIASKLLTEHLQKKKKSNQLKQINIKE